MKYTGFMFRLFHTLVCLPMLFLVACSPQQELAGTWACTDCQEKVLFVLLKDQKMFVIAKGKRYSARWQAGKPFENSIAFELADIKTPLVSPGVAKGPSLFNLNLGNQIQYTFPLGKPYFCLNIDDHFCFEKTSDDTGF